MVNVRTRCISLPEKGGWGGVNGKGVRGREGGRIQEGGKANKLEQGAK